jgi:lipoprotein-anchoring transpeptidase ErfK/SrfK
LRRLVVLIVLGAALAAPLAWAQSTAPVEPAPPPAPTAIPEGVTIAGTAVGGLTAEEAAMVVQATFDQPVLFQFRKRQWQATPAQLGASANVGRAVANALVAAPGTAVDLFVNVRGTKTRAYVKYLDRIFSREARDSSLRLRNLRPFLTKPRPGVKVLFWPSTAAIVQALRTNLRGPVELVTETLKPKVTRANFGPVVIIRRESKRLQLYRGMRPWRTFGVATGQASYPTPIGRFSIVVKWANPWWYPPASDWAQGLEPVPPGPGNPLGTRWMGISAPAVGIHGTPDAASIGYSASHGCIRMLIPEAEWLFQHVSIGTPVFIVRA